MSKTLDELRRRYFVGLAKSGACNSADPLTEFALAAMRSRFTRIPHRAGDGGTGLVVSDEPLLPDTARPLLIRLCAAKQTDHLAHAAAKALHRARLRPHPFDYYRLEDFIVRFAAELGTTAQAWAKKVQPAQTLTSIDDGDSVTENSFAGASRTAKLSFLRALRRSQPEHAREIMVLHFPNEPATLRSDFLDVLGIGLGDADLAFLTSAASDKAQSVRSKANSLLQRLPGTSAYKERLARLPDYIKVKTALVSRRKTLALVGNLAAGKLSELCTGLKLADIAETLGLNIEDFITAASEVPGLAEVVLSIVVAERKFEFVLHFESMLVDPGWLVGNVLQETHAHASPSDRERLIQTLVAPKRWARIPEPFSLERLHAGLNGPLSASQAADLLDAKYYRDMLAQDASPMQVARAEALAPLIPRSLSETFLADVTSISPRSALFHRFLLALPEMTTG